MIARVFVQQISTSPSQHGEPTTTVTVDAATPLSSSNAFLTMKPEMPI
jgi:hypothetical protein